MTPDLALLILAIGSIESGNNPSAIGKAGERGHLQISAAVVQDCNRIQRTVQFTHDDAHNPPYAEAMFRLYVAHYATVKRLGREPTLEDIARIWNKGPNGWRYNDADEYWEKVRDELFRLLKALEDAA